MNRKIRDTLKRWKISRELNTLAKKVGIKRRKGWRADGGDSFAR